MYNKFGQICLTLEAKFVEDSLLLILVDLIISSIYDILL